jgi:hypothetical protein
MRRCVGLFVMLCFASSAPAALAQNPTPTPTQAPGGVFGPLPDTAATPEPTPTPEPSETAAAQEDTDRRLLFAIGGALLLLFVVIGWFITRDARTHVPAAARAAAARQRDEGPHRHARQAKAKARAKGKARRAARRTNRPSR